MPDFALFRCVVLRWIPLPFACRSFPPPPSVARYGAGNSAVSDGIAAVARACRVVSLVVVQLQIVGYETTAAPRSPRLNDRSCSSDMIHRPPTIPIHRDFAPSTVSKTGSTTPNGNLSARSSRRITIRRFAARAAIDFNGKILSEGTDKRINLVLVRLLI